MKQKISFVVLHFFLLLLSPSIFACDDKSCENNYLVSAHKYINNSTHQAKASQNNKAKYSANYKRQQIALVNVRRAPALNKARRRYASKSRINLQNRKLSVVNEHRSHALNRARKGYALTHLKQRRQMLLNYKKQKRHPVNNKETDYDLIRFAQTYQEPSKAKIKKYRRHSKRNRIVALNSDVQQSTKKASLEKARKARVLFLQEQEQRRLANLKIRRANTLEREKKDYAKHIQRRNLAKTSERIKLNKAI